jgi:metal-dependent hydrolase (beta-lactamase superfamily II)
MDRLLFKMDQQNKDIAAEVRQMEEEKEAKRREEAMEEEEVCNITRRLIELGRTPPPLPLEFGPEGEVEGEGEGEDEVKDDALATESKPMVHNLVRVIVIFYSFDVLTLCSLVRFAR